jgi:hypothetical protein
VQAEYDADHPLIQLDLVVSPVFWGLQNGHMARGLKFTLRTIKHVFGLSHELDQERS